MYATCAEHLRHLGACRVLAVAQRAVFTPVALIEI